MHSSTWPPQSVWWITITESHPSTSWQITMLLHRQDPDNKVLMSENALLLLTCRQCKRILMLADTFDSSRCEELYRTVKPDARDSLQASLVGPQPNARRTAERSR